MDWIVQAPRLGEVFVKDSPADEVESEIKRMLIEAGYKKDQIRLEGFTDQILGWIKQGGKFRRCISAIPYDGLAIPGDTIYWNVEELSHSPGKFSIDSGVVLKVEWNWFLVQPEMGGPKRILKSWVTKPPDAPADIELNREGE